MTEWLTCLSRIRKWVRDPAGNVFTEAFLRRLWNDEQNFLFGMVGAAAAAKVIRTHPSFFGSYTHEWEWAYTENTVGDVYEVGRFYDADELTFLHVWEAEHLKGYSATTQELGYVYTHPWEAWASNDPFYPPPIPLPSDFGQALYVSYDRDRIDPVSQREAIADDEQTWKTRTGSPISYWRDQKNNNWIRIYPLPALTWQDSANNQGDSDEAEYASSSVDVDNNLLVIYRMTATDVGATLSEYFPESFWKYVEYGVAERALRANTDGRIESLADYWGMRKKAGHEVIRKYQRMKMSDRNLLLRTKDTGSGTRKKHARLPSTYPDPWV